MGLKTCSQQCSWHRVANDEYLTAMHGPLSLGSRYVIILGDKTIWHLFFYIIPNKTVLKDMVMKGVRTE